MAALPDDRPFWKPRDLAAMLQTSPSHVYRLVERGDLAHLRVGARAIRIPADAVASLLAVQDSQTIDDHQERADRFLERTDMTPVEFVDAWRQGKIEDTPDNVSSVIDALALREALREDPSTAR